MGTLRNSQNAVLDVILNRGDDTYFCDFRSCNSFTTFATNLLTCLHLQTIMTFSWSVPAIEMSSDLFGSASDPLDSNLCPMKNKLSVAN